MCMFDSLVWFYRSPTINTEIWRVLLSQQVLFDCYKDRMDWRTIYKEVVICGKHIYDTWHVGELYAAFTPNPLCDCQDMWLAAACDTVFCNQKMEPGSSSVPKEVCSNCFCWLWQWLPQQDHRRSYWQWMRKKRCISSSMPDLVWT